MEKTLKERIKAFKNIAATQDAESTEDFLNAITAKPEHDDILEECFERHKEPAEAWAALDEAREQLARKGADPKLIQEVDEALRLMDLRYGAAIRAGICGTLTAAQGYVSLGGAGELGTTYRKAVLEFNSVLDLYNYIHTNFADNFDKAVEFLYSALGADMACDSPSTEQVALERVNHNIGRLRSFQSAHALCDSQMERWSSVHHVTQSDLKSIDLLGNLLKLGGENYISASQVDTLASKAKAPDLEHRILFLQELLQNVRSFSPLVFDKDDARTKVIGAIQGAVDQAVNEEDELLAAQS